MQQGSPNISPPDNLMKSEEVPSPSTDSSPAALPTSKSGEAMQQGSPNISPPDNLMESEEVPSPSTDISSAVLPTSKSGEAMQQENDSLGSPNISPPDKLMELSGVHNSQPTDSTDNNPAALPKSWLNGEIKSVPPHKPIGEGAQAEVYEVRVREKNKEKKPLVHKEKKPLALKIYKSDSCRIADEVRCLKELQHENIVKIVFIESITKEIIFDRTCFLMELYSKSLKKRIEENLWVDKVMIWDYILQLLEGVNYIRKNLWSHSDLLPCNVMITESNVIKIIDFGSCKALTNGMVDEDKDKDIKDLKKIIEKMWGPQNKDAKTKTVSHKRFDKLCEKLCAALEKAALEKNYVNLANFIPKEEKKNSMRDDRRGIRKERFNILTFQQMITFIIYRRSVKLSLKKSFKEILEELEYNGDKLQELENFVASHQVAFKHDSDYRQVFKIEMDEIKKTRKKT